MFQKKCLLMRRVLKFVWSILSRLRLTRLLSDGLFVRLQYFCWHGGSLNLTAPRDYNEKIQWQKLHYRNPLMKICCDKYDVREYVRMIIGEEYLCKCLGVYEKADEINFDELPRSFVLKATRASSWNIVCNDKEKIDCNKLLNNVSRWLNDDFYEYGREWQYQGGKRRVICEQFIEGLSDNTTREYKLYTFHGVTKYIWVDVRRMDSSGSIVTSRNVYDAEYNFQPDKWITLPPNLLVDDKPPSCLQQLKHLAYKLAKDFPQCRVDFYVTKEGRIYFGEMTFTSQGGCGLIYPQSFCDELGAYIDFGGADESS